MPRFRAPWLIVALTLGCSSSTPWENELDWRSVTTAQPTEVGRLPNGRLCFADIGIGVDTPSGRVVRVPGSIQCDTGNVEGAYEVVAQGDMSAFGQPITSANGLAMAFGSNVYRFNRSGALVKETLNGPIPTAYDGSGRAIVVAGGSVTRTEPSGPPTVLLPSAPNGTLFVAPDDRVFVANYQFSSGSEIDEIVGGKLVPVLPCATAALANCKNALAPIGFDDAGNLYVTGLVVLPSGVTGYPFLKIDKNRVVSSLPQAPTPANPKTSCGVTGGGKIVCMYAFAESDDPPWSKHVELVEFDGSWNRIGLGPAYGYDGTNYLVAARDDDSVIILATRGNEPYGLGY